MAKSKHPPDVPETGDPGLTDAVDRLSDELHVLRDAIDEFREIFTYAVRSNRLRAGDHEQGTPESGVSTDQLETPRDDEQHERIAAAIQNGLSDVAGDVEQAVRDGLKAEFADFRDSVDQFSIDVQHAARKIHEHPVQELADVRETLQGEIVDLRGSVEQFMIEMHDAVGELHALVKPALEKLRCEPPQLDDSHGPEQIAAQRELAMEQEQKKPDSTTLQASDQDSIDLQWIARKAFTGSAAVAHAAQSSAPPSKDERQHSLFDS